MKDTAIVWFRNDLRLHDNEALVKAMAAAENIVPVYIFDERLYNRFTPYGFKKTGIHRARFILESVLNLKRNLQQKGSDLYVRVGKPEEIIAKLAQDLHSSWVFCNRERTAEEEHVQDSLERKLWGIGQEMIYTRGKMLYYTSDLPFPVKHTPDTFTNFRKEVENIIPIREPLQAPSVIHTEVAGSFDFGEMPTLEQWYKNDEGIDTRFVGGEDAALEQLKYYIWDKKLIANYKESRNELLGWDFSSKFSAWLALGCISPKQIHHEVKKFEKLYGASDSTYWLIFELLWRDFFRLMGKKYKNKIFQESGFSGNPPVSVFDEEKLKLWTEGKTGIPFIDANMRELLHTGYMSNRGRQNVASFLINELNLPWTVGAEYFESMLIDYDPCSNYGNWCHLAGVGNDKRDERHFNTINQSKKYDATCVYMKHWLPEVADVVEENIHRPGNGLSIKSYPNAIVKIG
jgi:deoxyribodipyrimidine photo-lyase